MEKLREVVVKEHYGSVKKGHFHGWCKEPVGEGDYTKTYALVEFSSGSVGFVEPLNITFAQPYQSPDNLNCESNG